MDKALVLGFGIGCVLTVVMYILMVYMAYWLIDRYTDFPTLVTLLLAWLATSLIFGILRR